MYEIHYTYPFYYLVKRKKFLWLIPYWGMVDFSHSLEEMEDKFKKLTS